MVQSKCPVGNCRRFWETLIQTFAAGLKRWDRWQRNIADDDDDVDDDGDCDDDDDGDDDDCDCPWKISHQSLWSNLITLRVGQKHRWQKNFFLRFVSAKKNRKTETFRFRFRSIRPKIFFSWTSMNLVRSNWGSARFKKSWFHLAFSQNHEIPTVHVLDRTCFVLFERIKVSG